MDPDGGGSGALHLEGGSGCDAGGGHAGWLLAVGVVLLGLRRRRR
jgi:MYXO-CTERM domain-containing protein